MGTFLRPGIYMAERTLAIQGKSFLALIEPGYDAVDKGAVAGSSVEEIIQLSQNLAKPIRYIAFSHAHGDHVGNLPFYLKRLSEAPFVIGHANSPVFERLQQTYLCDEGHMMKIQGEKEETLDEVTYRFLSTPGHDNYLDDICIYMPTHNVLCVGDLYQPQGPSYEKGDGVSPVPFFYEGPLYLDSLKKLLKIPFETLITGHGEVHNASTGHNGLWVTYRCIERMQELAEYYAKLYPKDSSEAICEWVYDKIIEERNYDKMRAQARKRRPDMHTKSDYEVYDRPGIRCFVMNVMSSGL